MLEAIKEYLPLMQKALVGGIVAAVLTFAQHFGVDAQMTFEEGVGVLVNGLLTGFFVWLFPQPNKK